MGGRDLAAAYDVVVAGARCAGASTAMLMAREGVRVLVVDPLPRGRDALSTHAIMRGGVLQLHRWGVLDAVRREGTPPVRKTTFDYGDEVVTIPIKARDGVDALFAPRRTVLDPILAEAAEAAGARVEHGLAVTGLDRDAGGMVRGAWVSDGRGGSWLVGADLVVGADGSRSRIARLADAEVEHRAAHATASVYGYWKGLGLEETRWYFRPGLGLGSIPTNGDETCVFVSMSQEAFARAREEGLEEAFQRAVLEADPALHAALAGAPERSALRAFPGMQGFLRAPTGPGWALVGDAGYFRDPLTAHGITDALRDAELLARSWVEKGREGLSDYRAARDRAAAGVMDVTDRIASLNWSMAEVQELHHVLAREMNVGVEVLRDFGVRRRPAA